MMNRSTDNTIQARTKYISQAVANSNYNAGIRPSMGSTTGRLALKKSKFISILNFINSFAKKAPLA